MTGELFTNQAILDYIQTLNQQLDVPEWNALYDSSIRAQIPVIRKDSARLLYLLAKIASPNHALEIGTGSGYSTLWIAKALNLGQTLKTVERDLKRFDNASHLFKGHPIIQTIHADIFKFLEQDTTRYDLVFLDSQKRDYIDLLPLLEPRMNPGALLITDNYLYNGRVVESNPEDRPGHQSGVDKLREYNHVLASHQSFETLFVPMDDGLAVSRKR